MKKKIIILLFVASFILTPMIHAIGCNGHMYWVDDLCMLEAEQIVSEFCANCSSGDQLSLTEVFSEQQSTLNFDTDC